MGQWAGGHWNVDPGDELTIGLNHDVCRPVLPVTLPQLLVSR